MRPTRNRLRKMAGVRADDAPSRPENFRAVPLDPIADRYLDLMIKSLTNTIYGDPSNLPGHEGRAYDPVVRSEGRDWPVLAHTMVGVDRLRNVRACVERAVEDGVPGDLVETGVWRGGSSIMMRAVLEALEVRDRRVWLADSFQGFPEPDPQTYPHDTYEKLGSYEEIAISIETVRANFEKYDLLDDQVAFIPGWFRDTLPNAPIDRIAVLRLDGDLYESTIVALRALYPKLSAGGFLIVDDYGAVPQCAHAVHDYRAEYGITEPIERIDWTGAYWRRRSSER